MRASRWWAARHSLVLFCLLVAGCSVKYNEIMTDKIRAALGKDFKGYQSFSYPTNNFGLATLYDVSRGPNLADQFICDMWNCIGVADTSIPEDRDAQLRMNGFAGVGDDGGTITFTESEKKKIALNVILPQLFQAVGMKGGVSKERVTDVTLNIGQAWPRNLRKKPMANYLRPLPADDPSKDAFDRGTLAVVIADVVVRDVSANVRVTDLTATELDAKFDPGVAEKIIKGADLSVKLTKESNGTYTFSVSRPVIALRYIAKQKAAGVLGAVEDWSDWEPVPQAEPFDSTDRPSPQQ
jgi:hypothetical protein